MIHDVDGQGQAERAGCGEPLAALGLLPRIEAPGGDGDGVGGGGAEIVEEGREDWAGAKLRTELLALLGVGTVAGPVSSPAPAATLPYGRIPPPPLKSRERMCHTRAPIMARNDRGAV
ncbi:hypothetical protein GCM10010415_66300 [Streptomyces atrovirens]